MKTSLYKVILFWTQSVSKTYTFELYVVASSKQAAEDVALETVQKWDYSYNACKSVELIAHHDQFGKPEILLIEGKEIPA